ncbi:MAG: sigma-70 family RNA polymerase sigma factor [Halanaerobiaceae bacterium]
MKPDNYRLWQKYKNEGDKQARSELIENYLHLVKYHAGRVKMLVPDHVEREDLESYGIIGLIDAVEKFDHRIGIKFTTYAARRIRGEIIDQLRRLDWLPSSLRKKEKEIREKKEELAGELGHTPDEDELLAELDMTREELYRVYHRIATSGRTSLDEDSRGYSLMELIGGGNDCPEKEFSRRDREEILARAVDKLAEKERLVLSLYYYEGLTQVEIAKIMELSPARISQLHKKAIYRLRGFLSRKKKQLI